MKRKIENKKRDIKIKAGEPETTEEIIDVLRFLREELRKKYNIPERK